MSKVNVNGTVSCDACQLAVISGNADHDFAVSEHLKSCIECQEFARFYQDLQSCDLSARRPLPTWTMIRQEAEKRRMAGSRKLRIWAGAGSLAAAVALVVAGFMFPMQMMNKTEKISALYTLGMESDVFINALDEKSILLAWDQADSEMECRNSMQDARQGATQWSIELFNPYGEEI